MKKYYIEYYGQFIEVDEHIADYLESERRRKQAEEKKDKRHLSDKDINSSNLNNYLFEQSEDFVDDLINKFEAERLIKAMNHLTDKQLKRIKLYFWNDLTYEEIAKLEGVSKMSVYESIRNALDKIKKNF